MTYVLHIRGTLLRKIPRSHIPGLSGKGFSPPHPICSKHAHFPLTLSPNYILNAAASHHVCLSLGCYRGLLTGEITSLCDQKYTSGSLCP